MKLSDMYKYIKIAINDINFRFIISFVMNEVISFVMKS